MTVGIQRTNASRPPAVCSETAACCYVYDFQAAASCCYLVGFHLTKSTRIPTEIKQKMTSGRGQRCPQCNQSGSHLAGCPGGTGQTAASLQHPNLRSTTPAARATVSPTAEPTPPAVAAAPTAGPAASDTTSRPSGDTSGPSSANAAQRPRKPNKRGKGPPNAASKAHLARAGVATTTSRPAAVSKCGKRRQRRRMSAAGRGKDAAREPRAGKPERDDWFESSSSSSDSSDDEAKFTARRKRTYMAIFNEKRPESSTIRWLVDAILDCDPKLAGQRVVFRGPMLGSLLGWMLLLLKDCPSSADLSMTIDSVASENRRSFHLRCFLNAVEREISSLDGKELALARKRIYTTYYTLNLYLIGVITDVWDEEEVSLTVDEAVNMWGDVPKIVLNAHWSGLGYQRPDVIVSDLDLSRESRRFGVSRKALEKAGRKR
jgi:hypothetical protein